MAHAPYDVIAEWYDQLVRTDPLYRELVLPSLLGLIDDPQGQMICDLACGQGFVARELARQGASVIGVDVSVSLLALARRYEHIEPLGIQYREDNAHVLATIADSSVDGVTCSMALMNIPDLVACARSVRRILKPDGWAVVAMTHPCFQTPRAEWVQKSDGSDVREVSGYFDEGYWKSPNPEGVRGQVGEHHRMLSTYLNTFVDAGFTFERMHEPQATGERAKRVPGNREIPSILSMRFRADRNETEAPSDTFRA